MVARAADARLANMHGGYALGLALIGWTGAGVLDELMRERGERQCLVWRLRPLVFLFAACVLVVR